jgi:hypothetical protein
MFAACGRKKKPAPGWFEGQESGKHSLGDDSVADHASCIRSCLRIGIPIWII